jgi:hypothetical protein
MIDHYYFPYSVFTNAVKLAALLIWTWYFFASTRVREVFLERTWGPPAGLTLQLAGAAEGSEGEGDKK